MIGVSLYILADTYFIANGIGELGLAALNISMPIYSVLGAAGNLIGIGGATLFSISRENGDKRTNQDVFSLCLLAASAAGVIFLLCGLFFSREIASLLGASADTMPYACIYIRVLLLFGPFFALNHLLTAFVRNDGNPTLAMAATLCGVAFNIVFDYILIYVTGWGMFGAVIATSFSPVVGLGVASLHFRARRNTLRVRRICPDARMFLWVLRGGGATFLTEIAGGAVIVGFNFKLLAMLGDMGVAAYGVISNVSYVMLAVFSGLGNGLQPIVSANFGAGLFDRCRRVLRCGMTVAFASSVLLVLLILTFPAELTALFNRDGDPVLARIAERGIVLYFTSFLLCGTNVVLIAYYQAMLDSRTSVWLSLTRGLIGVFAGLAVLPPLLGADGVWLTAPFAEILASLLAAVLMLKRRRGPA